MPADPGRLACRPQAPSMMLATQIAALTGDRANVSLIRERAWASITFTGIRYSFAVDWPETPQLGVLHNFAAALQSTEFALPGYFVADIIATEQSEDHMLIEALSIIDPVDDR